MRLDPRYSKKPPDRLNDIRLIIINYKIRQLF